jgi:hypothetical protein
MHCDFITNTRLNGLYDSHGVSSETFFHPRLKIEYDDALGFCSSNIDEFYVFNPIKIGETHTNNHFYL